MALLDRLRRKPAASAGVPTVESGRGHDEIATSLGSSGFVVPDEYKVELQGRAGMKVFDQMWRSDPDVRNRYLMLGAPVVGATWDVEAYGGDDATEQAVKMAEFVKWNLFEAMTPKFPAHLMAAWRILRHGVAPFEQVFRWDEWEGKRVLVIDQLHLILPRAVWRWPSRGERLEEIVVNTLDGTTVPILAQDLLYYRFGAEGDNWEGESMLRPAYKPWRYKDSLELVDAIGHERYHVGMPIGYAGAGATGPQQDALNAALAGIRSNATGHLLVPGVKQSDAHPEGTLIEILAPDREGSSDLGGSIERHRDGISTALFGEFMRLGQGAAGSKGALSTADVQQDPFYALVEAFTQVYFEDPINEQLVARLCALNFSEQEIADAGGLPSVSANKIDPMALDALAAALASLVAPGLIQVDDPLEDYLRERYDLPPADPKERAERKAQEEEQRTLEAEAMKAGTLPKPGDGGEKVTEKKRKLPFGGEHKETTREKLLPKKLSQDANSGGAMVALVPTADTARELAVDGGEPPEQLHVTLAYLGTASSLTEEQRDGLLAEVRDWARKTGQINGRVAGVGEFQGPDPVTYLSFDARGLPAAREDLVQRLEHAGTPASRSHGFTPHMSVAYAATEEQRSAAAAAAGRTLRFHSVKVWLGDERYSFPLGGRVRLAQASEDRDPRLAHLDVDAMRRQIDQGREHIRRMTEDLAAEYAQSPTVGGRHRLEMAFAEAFTHVADVGREQVRSETATVAPSRQLASRPRRDPDALDVAASMAARGVIRAVEGVQDRLAALGTDKAEAKRRTEDAARHAADKEAKDGVTLALNVGRTQEGDDLGPGVRALYTSLLDENRCEQCATADDGVERDLTDPVRLAHVPPNPDCYGWTRCRCIEVFTFPDDDDGGGTKTLSWKPKKPWNPDRHPRDPGGEGGGQFVHEPLQEPLAPQEPTMLDPFEAYVKPPSPWLPKGKPSGGLEAAKAKYGDDFDPAKYKSSLFDSKPKSPSAWEIKQAIKNAPQNARSFGELPVGTAFRTLQGHDLAVIKGKPVNGKVPALALDGRPGAFDVPAGAVPDRVLGLTDHVGGVSLQHALTELAKPKEKSWQEKQAEFDALPSHPYPPPVDFETIPDKDLGEPPMPGGPYEKDGKLFKGKRQAAGMVVVTDDGRIWTVDPKNGYAGYKTTLPKGGIEPGMTAQQTAAKELWEESGLTAEPVAWLGDFETADGVSRYYVAKQTGGKPDPGKESQQVRALTPMEAIGDFNKQRDYEVLIALLQWQIAQHGGPKQLAARVAAQIALGSTFPKVEEGLPNVEVLATELELHLALAAGNEHWRQQPRDPGGHDGGQWVKGPAAGAAFDMEAYQAQWDALSDEKLAAAIEQALASGTPKEKQAAYHAAVKRGWKPGQPPGTALPLKEAVPVVSGGLPVSGAKKITDSPPMKFDQAPLEDIPKYAASPEWVFQQKIDGIRAQLVLTEGQAPEWRSSSGEKLKSSTAMKVTEPISNALLPHAGPTTVIDGEVLDGKFHVFDLVRPGNEKVPYTDRKQAADKWVSAQGLTNIEPLPTAVTQAEKTAMTATVYEHGGEGVMMKYASSPYTPGKRVKHTLKAKFRSTVDAVVTGKNTDGHQNYELGVFDENGVIVTIGSTSGIGKPNAEVGDVMEVAYLYATADHQLVQPSVVKLRPDKTAADVSTDQLRYVNKDVLSAEDLGFESGLGAGEKPQVVETTPEYAAEVARLEALDKPKPPDDEFGDEFGDDPHEVAADAAAYAAWKEYKGQPAPAPALPTATAPDPPPVVAPAHEMPAAAPPAPEPEAPSVQVGKASGRNYKAMKDEKLAASIGELVNGYGKSYDFVQEKGADVNADLQVARAEAKARGLNLTPKLAGGMDAYQAQWDTTAPSADPSTTAAPTAVPPALEPKPPAGDGWPDLDQITTTGSAGGTTGAKFATGPSGEKYVVKTGHGGVSYAESSPEHLDSEITADILYAAMGVPVPEFKRYTGAGGGPVKVARFIKGADLGSLEKTSPNEAEYLKEQLRQDFAIDAWLGAWDAIGAGSEMPKANVMLGDDGKAYRLDNGGSLKFKGMGGLKPPGAWGNEAKDVDTLRSSLNPTMQNVFGSLPDDEVAAQIKEKLTPEKVGAALENVKDEHLKTTLVFRATWLNQWADEHSAPSSEDLVTAYEAAGAVDAGTTDKPDYGHPLQVGDTFDAAPDGSPEVSTWTVKQIDDFGLLVTNTKGEIQTITHAEMAESVTESQQEGLLQVDTPHGLKVGDEVTGAVNDYEVTAITPDGVEMIGIGGENTGVEGKVSHAEATAALKSGAWSYVMGGAEDGGLTEPGQPGSLGSPDLKADDVGELIAQIHQLEPGQTGWFQGTSIYKQDDGWFEVITPDLGKSTHSGAIQAGKKAWEGSEPEPLAAKPGATEHGLQPGDKVQGSKPLPYEVTVVGLDELTLLDPATGKSSTVSHETAVQALDSGAWTLVGVDESAPPEPEAPIASWPPKKGDTVMHPTKGAAKVLGPGPKGDPNYVNVQPEGLKGHSYWKLDKLKPADGQAKIKAPEEQGLGYAFEKPAAPVEQSGPLPGGYKVGSHAKSANGTVYEIFGTDGEGLLKGKVVTKGTTSNLEVGAVEIGLSHELLTPTVKPKPQAQAGPLPGGYSVGHLAKAPNGTMYEIVGSGKGMLHGKVVIAQGSPGQQPEVGSIVTGLIPKHLTKFGGGGVQTATPAAAAPAKKVKGVQILPAGTSMANVELAPGDVVQKAKGGNKLILVEKTPGGQWKTKKPSGKGSAWNAYLYSSSNLYSVVKADGSEVKTIEPGVPAAAKPAAPAAPAAPEASKAAIKTAFLKGKHGTPPPSTEQIKAGILTAPANTLPFSELPDGTAFLTKQGQNPAVLDKAAGIAHVGFISASTIADDQVVAAGKGVPASAVPANVLKPDEQVNGWSVAETVEHAKLEAVEAKAKADLAAKEAAKHTVTPKAAPKAKKTGMYGGTEPPAQFNGVAVDSAAKKLFHEWQNGLGLSGEQKSALGSHKANSETVNEYLRKSTALMPLNIAKRVKAMDEIYAKVPPTTEAVVVGRKTNLPEWNAALPGQVLQDNGYICTSTSAGVWSGSIHLKILVPKGSTNVVMGNAVGVGSHAGEEEVTIKRGTQFHIIERQQRPDGTVILYVEML